MWTPEHSTPALITFPVMLAPGQSWSWSRPVPRDAQCRSRGERWGWASASSPLLGVRPRAGRSGPPLLGGPSQEPPCPGLSLADAWQPQSPTLLSCSVPEGLTEPTRDRGTVALQCAPARHLAENAEASEEHVVGFSFFLSLWQHFLSGVADGEAFCGRGAGGGHMGPSSFCRASVTE